MARGREFRIGVAYFSLQSQCLGTDGEEIGLIVITVSGDVTNPDFTLYMNCVDKSRRVIQTNLAI